MVFGATRHREVVSKCLGMCVRVPLVVHSHITSTNYRVTHSCGAHVGYSFPYLLWWVEMAWEWVWVCNASFVWWTRMDGWMAVCCL